MRVCVCVCVCACVRALLHEAKVEDQEDEHDEGSHVPHQATVAGFSHVLEATHRAAEEAASGGEVVVLYVYECMNVCVCVCVCECISAFV